MFYSTPWSPLYSKDKTLKWMSQSVFVVPYQYLSADADWPPSLAAGETHGAHCTKFSPGFAVITLLKTCPQCRYYELLHTVNDLCHFAFLLSERTLNGHKIDPQGQWTFYDRLLERNWGSWKDQKSIIWWTEQNKTLETSTSNDSKHNCCLWESHQKIHKRATVIQATA